MKSSSRFFPSSFFTLSLASASALTLLLGGCLSDSGNSSLPKRMFVTSQVYSGKFGGVAAGDSICNTLATAAILGGTWKVFLSDDSAGALERTGEVGPWFRVDRETKIFNNRVGFTVGALAAIYTEYGSSVASSARVWTGTGADGTAQGSQNCSNWTSDSASDYGTAGNPNKLLADGSKWMFSNEGAAQCTSQYRLYCFEQ
jgi:hypothetical protein